MIKKKHTSPYLLSAIGTWYKMAQNTVIRTRVLITINFIIDVTSLKQRLREHLATLDTLLATQPPSLCHGGHQLIDSTMATYVVTKSM